MREDQRNKNRTFDLEMKAKLWLNPNYLAGRRLKWSHSWSSKPGTLASSQSASWIRRRTSLYTSNFCLCWRGWFCCDCTALLPQLSTSSSITIKAKAYENQKLTLSRSIHTYSTLNSRNWASWRNRTWSLRIRDEESRRWERERQIQLTLFSAFRPLSFQLLISVSVQCVFVSSHPRQRRAHNVVNWLFLLIGLKNKLLSLKFSLIKYDNFIFKIMPFTQILIFFNFLIYF